ncbi:hypothetical protein [Streptomyces sp. KL116D]
MSGSSCSSRRRRVDQRVWNTLIAPLLGALGIAGAIWLISPTSPP